MDKISCNVAKDLLPLYVDEVLSEDSCKLLKKHIDSCTACRENYEEMKGIDNPVKSKQADKEKAVIKKIRKTINRKRLFGICVTAILVLAIAIGTFYGLVHKQSYLPYADTGLYVENDELRTNKPYYCYYMSDSPEEGTVFIFMTTTFHDSHSENQKIVTVDDFSGLDTSKPDVKQVYYISQDYVEPIKNSSYFVSAESESEYLANNKSKLEELKENSTLVWSCEE